MAHRVIIAIVSVAALIVSACGGTAAPSVAPQSQSASAAPKALSGDVHISGWSSSPAEDQLLTDAIAAFMKANPGVNVKWEPIAKDYSTVLKTNLAAGTEADVFYVDVFEIDSLMKTNKLLALEDQAKKTNTNLSDYALIKGFQYQGKTYGIPKDFNTLGLVYNKDLFAKAGVKEPTSSWTWDDLKTAAKDLTKGGAVGVCLPADAARFVAFLWQGGGDIASINNDKGIAATTYYTSFEAAGTGKMPAEMGMGWCGEALAKGKSAIAFEGGWLPAFLDHDFKDVKYGVVQMPAGPSGKANLAFTVCYAISAKTKNPDASWALVNYLTGYDNQLKVLRSGFALPTRIALASDDALTKNPNNKAIFDGYAYAKVFNWGAGANNGKISDAINKALESILLKKSSVKDALDKAASDIKTLLQ